jgi:hypothetical protein
VDRSRRPTTERRMRFESSTASRPGEPLRAQAWRWPGQARRGKHLGPASRGVGEAILGSAWQFSARHDEASTATWQGAPWPGRSMRVLSGPDPVGQGKHPGLAWLSPSRRSLVGPGRASRGKPQGGVRRGPAGPVRARRVPVGQAVQCSSRQAKHLGMSRLGAAGLRPGPSPRCATRQAKHPGIGKSRPGEACQARLRCGAAGRGKHPGTASRALAWRAQARPGQARQAPWLS